MIKLPNELSLENWNSDTLTFYETTSTITATFYLTRAMLYKFKASTTFIANWGDFGDENLIESYIKNTITSYYNFNQNKLKLEYYQKSFDTQRMWYEYDDTFSLNSDQRFNGELLYENDEFIYKITMPYTGNFSYFVKVILTEK